MTQDDSLVAAQPLVTLVDEEPDGLDVGPPRPPADAEEDEADVGPTLPPQKKRKVIYVIIFAC
jgi:hypothetical protein